MPETLEYRETFLQRTAWAGMEFIWHFVPLAFLSHVFFQVDLHMEVMVFFYLIAASSQALIKTYGLRVWGIVLFQCILFSFSGFFLLKIGYRIDFTGGAVFRKNLIPLVLICIGIFLWITGIRFVYRKPEPATLVRRFDNGVASFIVTIFFSMVVKVPIENWMYYVFSFIFLGSISIAFVKSRSRVKKGNIHGWGMAASGISLILSLVALGALLLIIALPLMERAAQKGYEAVREAGEPLVPYLLDFIRFLFSWNPIISPPASRGTTTLSSQVPPSSPAEQTWLQRLVETLSVWGISILLAATAVVLLVLILRKLYFFLSKKTPKTKGTSPFILFLNWVISLFKKVKAVSTDKNKNTFTHNLLSPQLFKKLTRWSKKSGIIRHCSETPKEF